MGCHDVLRSQFRAALAMLEQAIERCPAPLWNDPSDKVPFWRIAYHALFYTHLYLQDSVEAFTPWSGHREHYQFLGPLPWPPHALPAIGEPYAVEDLRAYLSFCRQQIEDRIARVDLDAASGFPWLPMNKLELLLYTLRHLQQHTGELMERLGTRAAIDVDWISAQHDA